MEQPNTLCEQNAEFLLLNLEVDTVTSTLYRVKVVFQYFPGKIKKTNKIQHSVKKASLWPRNKSKTT
jgi:hypothetical protein